MISITDGAQTMEVTSGVYRELFKPLGWVPTAEATQAPHRQLKPNLPPIGESIHAIDQARLQDDVEPLHDDYEEEDVYEEPESHEASVSRELSEVPLSEMNFEELKQYAAQMNIDVQGLRSRKEVRLAIKQSQSEG